MSSSAVLVAIKAITANFATPIFWPNEVVVPPVDANGFPAAFIWSDASGLGSDLISNGSVNTIAQEGFIRFHIMGIYGQGLEPVYAIVDSLGALYRAAYPIAGLQIMAPTYPEVGAQSDDGIYYGVSFSVPWKYWQIA